MRKTIAIMLIISFILFGVGHGQFMVSFNSGELSPRMKYRIDLQKRNMGVEELQNMVVKMQGDAVITSKLRQTINIFF